MRRWVAAVAALILGLGVPVLAAPAASANPLEWIGDQARGAVVGDTCVTSEDQWSAPNLKRWQPSPSIGPAETVVAGTLVDDNGQSHNYGATAQEWFGSATSLGLKSFNFVPKAAVTDRSETLNPSVRATCQSGNPLGRMVSQVTGWMWSAGMNFADIPGSLVGLALDGRVMQWMADTLIVPIQQGSADTDGDGETDGGLNDVYFVGAIVVAAVVVGYAIYLVARGRFKDTGKNLMWTIVSLALGSVLLTFPMLLPTATTAAIRDVISPGVSMVAGSLSGVGGEQRDWCTLADDVDYPGTVDVGGQTVPLASPAARELQCRMWSTTTLTPWMHAQFGSGDTVIVQPSGTLDAQALQVTIPGLQNQPAAGDLAAMHLAATTTNPMEQRWWDEFLAGGGSTRDADTLLRGGSTVPLDREASIYPAAAIYGEGSAVAASAYGLGRQERFENLIDAVSTGSTFETWSGLDPSSRTTSLLSVSATGSTVLLSVGFFSMVAIYYQLLLGAMFVFLPLVLLGVALPFRVGKATAKAFALKIVETLLLMGLALSCIFIGNFAAVTLPMMMTDGSLLMASQLLWLQPVVSLVTFVGLVLVWRKAAKGFRGKMDGYGSNDGLMRVQKSVEDSVSSAGKTAATAALVVGASVASGGTAGAAVGSMAAQTAKSFTYSGDVGSAVKRGVRSAGAKRVSKSLGGGDEDEGSQNGTDNTEETVESVEPVEVEQTGRARRRRSNPAPAPAARRERIVEESVEEEPAAEQVPASSTQVRQAPAEPATPSAPASVPSEAPVAAVTEVREAPHSPAPAATGSGSTLPPAQRTTPGTTPPVGKVTPSSPQPAEPGSGEGEQVPAAVRVPQSGS